MSDKIFDRTIILWACAIIAAIFMVNPRAALLQRVNTMNGSSLDCFKDGNCDDTKAIKRALVYYKVLADLYPDYGRGAEMQGICYLMLKQDTMAIKKFREAVRHNPDLFWVSFELGKALYRRGDYPQALKCFQGIIDQNNEVLLKKATLSDLRQFPDKVRGPLMIELVDFVTQIKLASYQMAVGCLDHQINALAYAKPVYHPWGYIIEPLKEIMYR